MPTQKNKIIIGTSIAIVVLVLGVFLWKGTPFFQKGKQMFEKPKVVNDTIIVPKMETITMWQGRDFVTSGQNVSLVPKSRRDEVVVTNAALTLKGGFDLAVIDVMKWSSDAKLVYAKSLGTVTLDGKSSAWQYAFGSKLKKRGYEVVIQGDAISIQKETTATSFGFDIPKKWYDTGDAILSVSSLPQYADATMNSIIFFYSDAGKIWQYALATSRGTTTMLVR